jgi:ATP-binding cassette subfamily F protein 3
VFKKIRILSGGEKARVALAKTIISQANFLLLDEPTNHLDMNSVQMLIDALSKYEGSYVLVSHDRYFVSQTANKIWEIVDGEIKEFKGTYAEWEDWKKRQAAAALPPKPGKNDRKNRGNEPAPAPAPEPVAKPEPVAAPVKSAPIDKDAKRELQKLQKQFQQLEAELAKLNEKKQQLEAALGNPDVYGDKGKFQQVEGDYKQTLKDLERANKQYEEVFEKIVEQEG